MTDGCVGCRQLIRASAGPEQQRKQKVNINYCRGLLFLATLRVAGHHFTLAAGRRVWEMEKWRDNLGEEEQGSEDEVIGWK